MNFYFPPTGSGWTTHVRVTATGADGSTTIDRAFDSPDGYSYPGDQPGYASSTYAAGTDTSGGMTIDQTLKDVNGNTVEAYGMIYPPDPVTNTC